MPCAPKMILYSIAGAVVLSLIAIAIGLVINGGGTEKKAAEVFASWMGFFTGEEDGDADSVTMSGRNAEAGSTGLLAGPDTMKRSSHLLCEAEDGRYVIFASYQFQYPDIVDYSWYYSGSWERSGLCLIDLNEDGGGLCQVYPYVETKHIKRLVTGCVRQFCVMNGMLYYTMISEETGHTALYEKSLFGDEEERMLFERAFTDFYCGGGKIYYVDSQNGNCLYCYNTENEENNKVSDVQIGRYSICDGMMYFENRADGTLWKMRLDGTETGQIGLPCAGRVTGYGITICRYHGGIYLASAIEADGREELWLLAEDGSMQHRISESGAPRIDYEDGYLYYSSNADFAVRIFAFDRFFEGGSGTRTEDCYRLMLEEDIRAFEVTDHFILVRMYEENPDWIMIYDRLTGELLGKIDCWYLGQLE